MGKTRIDWADYSINPVRGLCPMDCKDNQGKPYCYARRMYKRFHWNPEIRYDDWVWQTGGHIPAGSKIFIGSTIELFHDKTIQYLPTIMEYVECLKSRTFIFLTKCPQNLPKKFPDNCWVGVSATNTMKFQKGTACLSDIAATKRFVSLEPLLDWNMSTNTMYGYLVQRGIHWLIVGQCTPISAKTAPKIEWIREIVEAADKADIPVFLKNNLQSLLPQERPFYTKPCADINGQDPCYQEPCLSDKSAEECSTAPNYFKLRQELPRV